MWVGIHQGEGGEEKGNSLNHVLEEREPVQVLFGSAAAPAEYETLPIDETVWSWEYPNGPTPLTFV